MVINSESPNTKSDFLKKIDHLDDKYRSLISKSSGFISPGDILRFSYSGETVNVLVVSTKIWSKSGIFLSTKNNILLSCYKLNDVGEEEGIDASSAILKKILLALYNNRGLAQYKDILAIIGDIAGDENFKTYNLIKTGRIFKITLDSKRLNLSEDEFFELEDVKKDRKKITKKRNKLLESLRKLEKYLEDRN
jgi:hypothetical protein